MTAIVAGAVSASPLVTGRSPSEPIASQLSLLHRALIYAKEGSRRLALEPEPGRIEARYHAFAGADEAADGLHRRDHLRKPRAQDLRERREPVLAKGQVRSLSSGFFGGPPFYYADIDLDVGGSGGAVFAVKNGRPVTDGEGRLVLRGLLVAVGPNGKNGAPYSEDHNYTIVIGLQSQFRDLVEGKAFAPVAIEPAICQGEGEPAINVIAEPVPQPPPDPFAAAFKCSGKKGEANAACIAKELEKLSRELETVSTAPRAKKKRQFKLENGTAYPVCFTYDRCNEYGCWDETVRASGKSILFAGVRKEPPTIRDPQFCKSGQLFADLGPPLPLRKPAHVAFTAAELEVIFAAAKDKAEREGVYALTAEDVRGLNLEQIRQLRGY